MLEKDINLVNIDPCVPAQRPVADDPVKHAVQHHQHPHRQKLFAQIPDVIAQDPGVRVHVSGLGKGVEAALGEQFYRQGHVPRLRLGLAEQFGVEVLEGRRFPLVAALDVAVVDIGGAAVDDGFLFGGQQPVPHELLTQGQQELGLQHDRIFSVPVALLHVHGVDVVGGGSGDIHHFAAQPFDEGPVLRFGIRVTD